ncbi:hypothetical protein [Permianibacter aggregans]|uniref:Uncharacterized protein n=1 Tax=Permianibacter aggregans TaxID=1510150 RepID=A0A4R6UPQ5_9GAMM|nr:hypothetical protein [Permianibacter aggregans]QGX40210.1 hypothetical protein E2H98_11215 [Permianibacter aggregans]TDQ47463.1 hypothetical protein EV696_11055 [Permianibacter aggregans]
MRKLFIIFIIAVLTGCNVQYVDVNLPVASAEKFYGALKVGDIATALVQFSPEFRRQVENWPQLLGGLQEKYGYVTQIEIQSSSLVAKNRDPCYILSYAVKRGELKSNEVLLLCSSGDTSPWLIHGHKLTRLDTQQSVSAGTLPDEVSIQTP